MIDKTAMKFANDVWQLYLRNVPLQKAIQQVRYIMYPTEVLQAKHELIRLGKAHYKQADEYRSDSIGKELHTYKQKHGCYKHLN